MLRKQHYTLLRKKAKSQKQSPNNQKNLENTSNLVSTMENHQQIVLPIGPPAVLYRCWTVNRTCSQCSAPFQDHYSESSRWPFFMLICVPCFSDFIRRIVIFQRLVRNKIASTHP